MLRQHPDVFITDPKEPHFLAFANTKVSFEGPGDDITVNRLAVTSPTEYHSLFAAADEKVRGDASVSTLYYADAALNNIARYFPSARLIVVLREPLARAFSAYSYLKVRGFESCPTFHEAVQQEVRGHRKRWQHLWQYVDMSLYYRQLYPFLETLGSSRIHILFYDDLASNPTGAAKDVLEFLDLDPNPKMVVHRVNSSGNVRSTALQRAIQWAGHRPTVRSFIRAVVPFHTRERLRAFNLRTQDAPPWDSDLQKLFAGDLGELAQLLEKHYGADALLLPNWLSGRP